MKTSDAKASIHLTSVVLNEQFLLGFYVQVH